MRTLTYNEMLLSSKEVLLESTSRDFAAQRTEGGGNVASFLSAIRDLCRVQQVRWLDIVTFRTASRGDRSEIKRAFPKREIGEHYTSKYIESLFGGTGEPGGF
jgi:hypothetical protein